MAGRSGQSIDMAQRKYPNESMEYRQARNALLEAEQALIEQIRALAAQRRALPPGGKVPEDYVFIGANNATLGEGVRMSGLFGDKDTLILYSMMFGPNWDNPCLSCTSIVDGFNQAAISVADNAALAVVTAATAKQLNAWANERGWKNLCLVSAEQTGFLKDYRSQTGDDDKSLQPVIHVFRRQPDGIYHFWSSELRQNAIDMVWVYWNLMDTTPEGRPDRLTPPQNFWSKYLEEHYLPKG